MLLVKIMIGRKLHCIKVLKSTPFFYKIIGLYLTNELFVARCVVFQITGTTPKIDNHSES